MWTCIQAPGELALHLAVRVANQASLPLGGFHHPKRVRTFLLAAHLLRSPFLSLFPISSLSCSPSFASDADPLTYLFPSYLPASLTPQHLQWSPGCQAHASDGNSALHCAALYNQLDCLKLLLKGEPQWPQVGLQQLLHQPPFLTAPRGGLPALIPRHRALTESKHCKWTLQTDLGSNPGLASDHLCDVGVCLFIS